MLDTMFGRRWAVHTYPKGPSTQSLGTWGFGASKCIMIHKAWDWRLCQNPFLVQQGCNMLQASGQGNTQVSYLEGMRMYMNFQVCIAESTSDCRSLNVLQTVSTGFQSTYLVLKTPIADSAYAPNP